MSQLKKIFKYQLWNLLSLIGLLLVVGVCLTAQPTMLEGQFLGVTTNVWLWIAIATPILHQLYVWIIWRLELYRRTFTTRYGLKRAFAAYSIGFFILIVGRLITIILLAMSNKDTLNMPPSLAYVLAGLIMPLVMYLFYSVHRYFTIERAYGIDHFDPNYCKPFEKKGLFKYTNNGMYVVGLLILYVPGLLFLSQAALLVALFNHAYIWVHYYCTERPDMIEIYGVAP